jgi:hypothetical protein
MNWALMSKVTNRINRNYIFPHFTCLKTDSFFNIVKLCFFLFETAQIASGKQNLVGKVVAEWKFKYHKKIESREK